MNPAPSLFLIGPMGAGKTSIGKRLALQFGLRFIDLDHELEARTGVRIPLIFDIEGEAGFRARESQLLQELVQEPGLLLATGGGSILDPANRTALRSHGFVVFIQTSVEQQLDRLAKDKQRPLLQTPDRQTRLEALATVRNPLYAETADLIVPAACAPVDIMCKRLIHTLQNHWQRGIAA